MLPIVALKMDVLFVWYWNCTKSVFVFSLRMGYLSCLFVCMCRLLVFHYSYMFNVKHKVISAVNDSKKFFFKLAKTQNEWSVSVIITYNNFVFQNVADNCHSLLAKCLLCANFITREMKERENE
jgi:hypothetical protein